MTETTRTDGQLELDPRWVVSFGVTAANRRAVESMVTLSDGRFARRGLPIEPAHSVHSGVYAAGVYDDGEIPALLELPANPVVLGGHHESGPPSVRLDLLRGTLAVDIEVGGNDMTITQFASIVSPGLNVVEIVGPTASVESILSSGTPPTDHVVSSSRGAIAASSVRKAELGSDVSRAHEITAFASSPPDRGDDLLSIAAERRDVAAAIPVRRLRTAHEEAWRRRWQVAATDLPGVPDLERAIRFAQFHLLQSASDDRESAIGARGLTGTAYRGHVFWDSDVFTIPALAAMAPALARSAIGYRVNRIGTAMVRAQREGRRGARFPWESADTGEEVTPIEGMDLRGRRVAIRTGEQEEHVVADVAWSAARYLAWTGDDEFRRGPAAQLLIETARYWRSRIEIDDDGSGHLRGVIGPDEYHEDVDDNAYTNVMARWNLLRAARSCETTGTVEPAEVRAWRDAADRLVDGFRADVGHHEQFDGYFELEPLLAASLGKPPLSADMLLGVERIARSQIIKQPDVLMLHHLLPDELPPGSLALDLSFYLPRTSHGSSLSPAICASLLARAGQPDDARRWFELAARMDLDDLSRTTAGGVHLATMGGLWQAINQGFLGVAPSDDGLRIDPRVPVEWATLTQRFQFRSTVVTLRASADQLELTSPEPVSVIVGGEHSKTRRLTAIRRLDDWEIR